MRLLRDSDQCQATGIPTAGLCDQAFAVVDRVRPHSFERRCLAARSPPRRAFGTDARSQGSVLGGFADLRALDVKDAEQLPSPRHPVTTFSTLSDPYVDGNTAIRVRLFAMPNRTSTWRSPRSELTPRGGWLARPVRRRT